MFPKQVFYCLVGSVDTSNSTTQPCYSHNINLGVEPAAEELQVPIEEEDVEEDEQRMLRGKCLALTSQLLSMHRVACKTAFHLMSDFTKALLSWTPCVVR